MNGYGKVGHYMPDVGRTAKFRQRRIGHTPRKPVDTRQNYTTSVNLGQLKIGRPRNTRRRGVEADVKETGYNITDDNCRKTGSGLACLVESC